MSTYEYSIPTGSLSAVFSLIALDSVPSGVEAQNVSIDFLPANHTVVPIY